MELCLRLRPKIRWTEKFFKANIFNTIFVTIVHHICHFVNSFLTYKPNMIGFMMRIGQGLFETFQLSNTDVGDWKSHLNLNMLFDFGDRIKVSLSVTDCHHHKWRRFWDMNLRRNFRILYSVINWKKVLTSQKVFDKN